MVLNNQQSSKLLIYGLCGTLFMAIALLILLYDPVEMIINMKMMLTNGSLAYTLWRKPPNEILLRVFIFNVTNGDRFMSGEDKNLKLNEVGPFVYQEILENTNPKFNDNGTLSFIPRRKAVFRPDKSIGDPKLMNAFVPNIPFLGITSALHDSSMILNLAVNSLVNYLDTKPILNLTIEEYLWGYDDRLVDVANNILPTWIDFKKFGVLERMFEEGENLVTMNVDTTIKPSTNPFLSEAERRRPYSIQLWNGSPGLEHWGYKDVPDNMTLEINKKCNVLEGAYEGIIFPRHISPNDTFMVYKKPFCRTVPIVYDSEAYTKDGFRAFVYKFSPDFLKPADEVEMNECYCKKFTKCLPKGLTELTPCYYTIPAAVSQPHFLNGDPILFNKLEGIAPNVSKHESKIYIQPDTGIPIFAKSRIQINIMMHKTIYHKQIKPFNEMTVPLFWIELSLEEVPSKIALLIRLVIIAPYAQIAVIVCFAVSGVALFFISLSGFFYTRRRLDAPLYHDKIEYAPVKMLTMTKHDLLFHHRDTM